MPESNFRVANIKGLLPSVEPSQTNDLFVLNGRNYVFDTRGPKSSFGNRLLLPQKLGSPEYVQGIRIKLRGGDRAFTFTNDSILEWDESLGGWKIIYVIQNTLLSPSRWTWGYLNGYVYFCHPRTGILVLNLETELCVPHAEIGVGTPDEALAILINNGFLVAVTPVGFSWSSPSNGLDFTPQLGGAGLHLISDSVAGFPIMVTSYTRGCLTWTSGGVMRSEFTGDAAVFRHRALQTEYRPVNPFCTSKIDSDTVIILDERGLFQSRGESPTPLTPIFNEFLLEYIQENNLDVNTNLRIEWDELQRRLYVMTSLSESNPIFETTFVLYPSLDKWGQFNDPTYGILPIQITGSARADEYYGYVDSAGRVRYWQHSGFRQVTPETSSVNLGGNLFYPPSQKPYMSNESDECSILSSGAKANTFETANIAQAADFYPPDGLTPLAFAREGLNSLVLLGLFRAQGEKASDHLAEVSSLLIRSVAQDNTHVGTGFNISPPAGALSQNQVTQAESFGFQNSNYVNHKLRVIGTLDGSVEFDSEVPSLVSFTKTARHYSCSVVGKWHILELSAQDIGESFHPVTIEMTSADAGRLN
jgi:hypothetical protein